MNVRAVATLALGIVGSFTLTAVISALISANVGQLAAKHGWDNFLVRLTERWNGERLRGMWWLWTIFGLSTGVAGTLWLAPLPQALVVPQSVDNSGKVAALQFELDVTKRELDSTKQQLALARATSTMRPQLQPHESDILKELRQSDGVRIIDATQNEMSIARIPDGSFGYVSAEEVAYSIQHKKPFLISKNNAIFHFEVHKAQSGTTYIIGFVTEEDRIQFEDPTHRRRNYTIFSDSYREHVKPIKIPVTELKVWDYRFMSGDAPCIAEITLKTPHS